MSPSKVLFLALLFVVVGLGYIGGWIVFFLGLLSLGGLYLGSFIIWRRNLPVATVNVDGHEIKFKYVRLGLWEALSTYKNAEAFVVDDKMNKWLISMKVFAIPQFYPLDSEGQGETYPATLSLENEFFSFSMDAIGMRCPCGSVPPCWTGKLYSAVYLESRGTHSWLISLDMVKVDERYGRRRPKHTFKEEKDFGIGMEPVFT